MARKSMADIQRQAVRLLQQDERNVRFARMAGTKYTSRADKITSTAFRYQQNTARANRTTPNEVFGKGRQGKVSGTQVQRMGAVAG